MNILLTISGVIVLFYTFSSVVGLWLSHKIMDATADGNVVAEALEGAPAHHVELMANYARGWRRHAWQASIFALFTTLIAIVINSPLAFWALGTAIIIDSTLFISYAGIGAFLAKTDARERLIDVFQSLALLAALAILYWVNIGTPETLG